MKKETFSNGAVEQQIDTKFIERLELETSLVEFYSYKQEILKRLRGSK